MTVQVNEVAINKASTASSGRSFMRFTLIAVALALCASVGLNVFLGAKLIRSRRILEQSNKDAELQVGSYVPRIKARALDGSPAIVDYSQAELPTLLYFFSPGCDTCEANVENFKKLASSKVGEFRIVALSLADQGADQFARDHQLNVPVYEGLGVETTLTYKLGKVPQTTVVSRDGRVLANWNGSYGGKLKPAIESYFNVSF